MDPMDAFALAVVKFDMNDILRWLFVRLPKKGDSFLGLTADESDVPAGRLKGLDAYLCRMPAADLLLIGDMLSDYGRSDAASEMRLARFRAGRRWIVSHDT